MPLVQFILSDTRFVRAPLYLVFIRSQYETWNQ